ncbi:hypothetical protein JTB14_012016 [Gonioctena quinquepunctata]|nr:hypothetical protein JTB14_012016 [Gonioctena quinquepunctata]
MRFSYNTIGTIPKKAFGSLKKLKKINFEYNEISTIETGAFEGLNTLELVNLSHNRLKIINEDIFPNPISISRLEINANYLNFLSNELLRKLTVGTFLIDSNPWKCSCLDRIYYWMFTTNVTLGIEYCLSDSFPVCASPTTYSQSCLENIDDDLTERYIDELKNLQDKGLDWCPRW